MENNNFKVYKCPSFKACRSVDSIKLKNEVWSTHSSSLTGSNFQIWSKREEMKGRFVLTGRTNLFATYFKVTENKICIHDKKVET